MIILHARKAMHASSLKTYSLATKGVAGLVMLTFLTSCMTDPAHKEALKLAKEGPVEEGIAKLKDSSSQKPENQAYRVDYLRERERVINQLLLDAVRALNKGDLDEAEVVYQRVLTIESENAQAKLGLKEVERSRHHAEAIISARDALEQDDYKAAQKALKPVLIENPLDTEAQNLSQQIDAARYTGASFSQVPELGAAYKKPVSLQFKDTNLKMIFEAISKTSGLNILIDKDIKNDLKATVFVKQASVEDTINLILMQNQLEKKVLNETTLYIYPSTPAKLKEHQDLVIRTFQLTNADAKQIQILLKTLLKAKDLFVNEKTNSIVMRDTPDVVALAAKLIAAQDVNEPEVMLEMEVLEVTHNLATELGLAYPDQVSVQLGSSIKTLQDWKGINATKFDVTPGLGVTLNLKKTDGAVNTLANPRIRVKQREKAKIHIGERFPIITNTVTPSTGTPVVTGSIQYIDLGLKLEVEPEIHIDGEVGIKTTLEVSSLGAQVTSGSGDSKTTAYRVNTRVANTVLRLKDGETQVLAGLINDEDRQDATKVPGLGDIPLLGRLFSSHKQDKNKTELILAITPHIIRNIHQPNADLAAYWSGTDGTVRSRPVTVEKMDTMKMESSGASILPGAASGPIQVPQPIVVPQSGEQDSVINAPSSVVKPYVAPNNGTVIIPANRTPTPKVPAASPAAVSSPAGVPLVVPRSAVGSAGMSDAVVEPVPAQ
jgi:general secretion pathway protein D